jgi:hypothetical protein
MEAYLDVCLVRCPKCRAYYAEASWYAAEIGGDLECGKCREIFASSSHIKQRFLLKFLIKRGKIAEVVYDANKVF